MAALFGGLALLSQPLVVVSQLVVATRWETPYDLTRNTVSELGVVGCGTIRATGGQVVACSPWHAAMNVTFVIIGSLLALGAVLVASSVVRGLASGLAMVLLLVAGISSAAVGFFPLDVDAHLHTVVATPLFVTQPIALLLVGGYALTRRRRGLGVVLLGTGLVAAAGGLAFAMSLVDDEVGGLYERIALWPCHLGIAALGWSVLRAASHRLGDIWETAA